MRSSACRNSSGVSKIRLGILGAASIAPKAVVDPARLVDEIDVVAVAARTRSAAERFAREHGVPSVVDGYGALISDKKIDAVYIPLPNGLHGAWTIAALEAGKHVLCEKPVSANAQEARDVRAAARRTGLVVMEAFHYRYHPAIARVVEIVASGALGSIRRVESSFRCDIAADKSNIRWQAALAGGALMDVGCYPLHLLRTLVGQEPEIVSASADLYAPGVDGQVEADLIFPCGVTGRLSCSMQAPVVKPAVGVVVGDEAELRIERPFSPQLGHRISVRAGQAVREEQQTLTPSYVFQLRAFADAVLDGASVLTGPDDFVANMDAIDAIYRRAGLEPRQPTALGDGERPRALRSTGPRTRT
jgi:predicted dehydrogenase